MLTQRTAGLCLSTALVVLFAAGVARARAQSRFNPMHRRFGQASLWSTLYAEGAQFVLPLWLAQVVDSVRPLPLCPSPRSADLSNVLCRRRS